MRVSMEKIIWKRIFLSRETLKWSSTFKNEVAILLRHESQNVPTPPARPTIHPLSIINVLLKGGQDGILAMNGTSVISLDTSEMPPFALNDTAFGNLLRRMPRLKSLNISSNMVLTGLGVSFLFPSKRLDSNHPGCPDLERVEAMNCKAFSDNLLYGLAAYCPKLRHLNVTWCVNMTDFGVKSVLNKCKSLQVLVLDFCMKLTDSAFDRDEGVDGGSLNLFDNLELVSLRNCPHITTASEIQLRARCPRIKTIDLTTETES